MKYGLYLDVVAKDANNLDSFGIVDIDEGLWYWGDDIETTIL